MKKLNYFIGKCVKISNLTISGQAATFIILGMLVSGCNKLIEVEPPITSLVTTSVFQSDPTAIAAMNSVFTRMSGEQLLENLSIHGSLCSDELTLFATGDVQLGAYYQNSLLSASGQQLPDYWVRAYNAIFEINAVIEGINQSSKLSGKVKQQLLGEAKFARAFYYFYLVNLYGDVPLVTGTDPKVNATLQRNPKTEVYKLLISDLQEAKALLSEQFVSASNGFQGTTLNRIRPTNSAAAALLSRVYLYNGQFAEAEKEATAVINKSAIFRLVPLNNVYLNNSQEAIWQLQPLGNSNNINGTTIEAKTFVLISTNGPTANTGAEYHPVILSNHLISAFESGDDRANKWINSVTAGTTKYYYANKYKVGNGQGSAVDYTESPTPLRLAEVFLVRAEALARQGKKAEAVADVNTLRSRARAAATPSEPNPLPALAESISDANLLLAIEHERQVELFTEWGHRWFDLKRTPGFNNSSKSRADEIMPAVMATRNGTWNSNAQLFPIPQSEISADYKLIQNPGY